MTSNRARNGRGKLRAHLLRECTRLLNLARGKRRVVSLESATFRVDRIARKYHRLYHPLHLSVLANRCNSGSSEIKHELDKFLVRLQELGPWRPLAATPTGINLTTLRARFPNFGIFLDFLEGQLALAASTPDQVAYMAPALLLGDPGIGKTAFAKALAALLGTAYLEMPMQQSTAGFAITGSHSTWSSAKPGRIFESLAFETVSNPLVLLDEVDKAAGDDRYDVANALLALLERENAKAFVDEYASFPIDASRIMWIATANTVRTMSEPLLSRFQVFHIREPSASEATNVYRSVYRSLRESTDWGCQFPEELRDDALAALNGMTPREASRALLEAAGAAVLNGRTFISPEDIHVFKRIRSSTSIGFRIS